MNVEYKKLGPPDISLLNGLLDCFGNAFEEEKVYSSNRPSPDLLVGDIIALVAIRNKKVVGGLVA